MYITYKNLKNKIIITFLELDYVSTTYYLIICKVKQCFKQYTEEFTN